MELTDGASMHERAYESAIGIIQNHKPYSLPADAPETMDEIVKEFEKELGICN